MLSCFFNKCYQMVCEFMNPFTCQKCQFKCHTVVCLFVTMRPAGTRVFANYIGTVLQKFQ
jgi:hypothetical protein